MNYRHAFHAGNFADVVKHAVLVRILLGFRNKPAAFRVIDTHAGAGIYDLASPEASRSREWEGGIQRLFTTPASAAVKPLLAPYLHLVAELNSANRGRVAVYPGSPAIVRTHLRSADRLIACELEPTAAAGLTRQVGGDRRVKVIAIDGWTALKAYVPPPERRGLVLVDPPFEASDEFQKLARGLEGAHRKWPTGIYLAWYPIKNRLGPDELARRLKRTGIAKILRVEVNVAPLAETGRLAGCGLVVINPPWTLADELALLLPELAHLLGSKTGTHRLDWLARES
jgi:23S rRNA (adenine2030-N6)-methyltransferase